MAEFPPEITQRFEGTPEQNATALVREPPKGWRPIAIEDYDPAWAERYAATCSSLREILGDQILGVEHVGSTSVPGLPAKAIVDIDLTIADTGDESRYVPALEAAGYFLILREPWWYGHRMLVDAEEDIHLHVWPQGAPEATRHLLFRDWLRTHPEDRDLYAATKRRLALETGLGRGYTMAKSDVIDDIFGRIFTAGPSAGR
ncbi:GrpB family protein [Actinoplanes sp. NPDC049596]|uniref:GrpB family protein n=1 Tax=unclassified Actinoplanes TaxID=2626549 RepID=UPI0034182A44